ncbi:MAG: MoaD/ThiS family protein [Methanomassiliicoccales archaeon]
MLVTARYITSHTNRVEMVDEKLELWAGATVNDLRKALLKKRPDLDVSSDRTKAAMGHEFVRSDTLLLDGDTVTFNPVTREEKH